MGRAAGGNSGYSRAKVFVRASCVQLARRLQCLTSFTHTGWDGDTVSTMQVLDFTPEHKTL